MVLEDNIVNKKVILRFDATVVEQPIVYRLVKDFDLIPNILKASIDPEKRGYLLLGLSGYENDYREALAYMRSLNLEVQPLAEQVSRDPERCTQCGVCTGLCPSGALHLQRPEQTVHFDAEKCVMCNHCIKACPAHAMMLEF